MPGSVGGELHLIELQIDRRFAAEHGNGDAHPVLFDVQLLDDAAEARQRAVHDADRVADLVANDDLALFDAELNDLILRQGGGLGAAGCDKPGDAADVLDDIPGVVRHDHLHQHIAGEDLAVIGLRTLFRDFGHGFHGDGDLLDDVLQLTGLDRFFNGRHNGIFITGIGMHNIPFCCFCHTACPDLEQLAQQADQLACAEIEQADDDTDDQNGDENDDGVVHQLLAGGPDDLLQLALHFAEPAGKACAHADKDIRLLVDFCHCFHPFPYFVSV